MTYAVNLIQIISLKLSDILYAQHVDWFFEKNLIHVSSIFTKSFRLAD